MNNEKRGANLALFMLVTGLPWAEADAEDPSVVDGFADEYRSRNDPSGAVVERARVAKIQERLAAFPTSPSLDDRLLDAVESAVKAGSDRAALLERLAALSAPKSALKFASESAPVEVKGFRRELRGLINRHNRDSGSNTPDFFLAEYLDGCLSALDRAVNGREEWYGRKPAFSGEVTPPKCDGASVSA